MKFLDGEKKRFNSLYSCWMDEGNDEDNIIAENVTDYRVDSDHQYIIIKQDQQLSIIDYEGNRMIRQLPLTNFDETFNYISDGKWYYAYEEGIQAYDLEKGTTVSKILGCQPDAFFVVYDEVVYVDHHHIYLLNEYRDTVEEIAKGDSFSMIDPYVVVRRNNEIALYDSIGNEVIILE